VAAILLHNIRIENKSRLRMF